MKIAVAGDMNGGLTERAEEIAGLRHEAGFNVNELITSLVKMAERDFA